MGFRREAFDENEDTVIGADFNIVENFSALSVDVQEEVAVGIRESDLGNVDTLVIVVVNDKSCSRSADVSEYGVERERVDGETEFGGRGVSDVVTDAGESD